jgi:hypothetical protein
MFDAVGGVSTGIEVEHSDAFLKPSSLIFRALASRSALASAVVTVMASSAGRGFCDGI